jgi:UDP-2,3-diacylglucosamine pyrophosphatase LpxH
MTEAKPIVTRRKVFVFSDWHLGGDPDDLAQGRVGAQICRSADQITGFIDWVGTESATFPGTTEIVINGDMVDFLAPDSVEPATEWIADQTTAIRRLDRIVQGSRGTTGRGPFEALHDFLGRPSTELTISLGNHDVELALPLVRQRLAQLLGNNPRFRICCDGEAIVRGRLLIEHGNRYDDWNALNYNGLREECSHLSRGFEVGESDRESRFFTPPAGTLMVIYGINTVLDEVPFINLLKPETEAALPLLIAIEPNLGRVLNNVLSLAPVIPRRYGARLQEAAVPANRDNLSAAPVGTIDSLEKALRPLLGQEADLFLAPAVHPLASPGGAMKPLAWIKARTAQIAAAIRGRLDFVGWLKDSHEEARWRLLESAFKRVQDHHSAELNKEASNYLDAATAILKTGKFDVVVFGHTHLQKIVQVPRNAAAGCYINTGTWADIMKLPPAVAKGGSDARQALIAFFTDIAAKNITPYLFRSLSYAEVELENERIVAHALRAFTKMNPRGVPQTPYA